ncbi:class I SAM-dependent DNA methyltransferase [Herbidospora sp. RD11066]
MDDHFGDEVAARYDDPADPMFQAETVGRTADVLADLAGEGRALEFAIGTGRIALPLAARGVDVHGIDLSHAMVARMRDKPGGDLPVVFGDFATTRVEGEFALVYLVYNTIMNLTTQDAQVDCFRNAAAHLPPGGAFVVEVGVPVLRLLPPGQTAIPFRVAADGIAYDVYDVATQAMSSNYVEATGEGEATFRSIPFRYVWPSELDLMARLAGMRLEHRWADWAKTPFTAESTQHVSVWRKVSPAAP